MMGRRIQMQQLTQIIVLVALGIFWCAPNEADAAEQRCDQLGASCVCSEPLQATAYLQVGILPYWNPNDSTSKECSGESPAVRGGFIIENSPAKFSASSDPTILNALPPGNSVARVFKTSEGYTGIFESGHVLGVSGETPPLTRVAARWYQYYSPNFVWSTTATCSNSGKLATFYAPGLGPQITTADGGGNYTWYGWADGWNIDGLDCCNVGPGLDPTAENNAASRRGRWFRYELVFVNATGARGLRVQLFSKNVTDGQPEKALLDSYVECPSCGTNGWTAAQGATTNFTPRAALARVEFPNLFRWGTDCPGFAAVSHAMLAAWPTDTGQRIGAAVEVEGGGGSNPAPNAPVGLIIQ